MFAICQYNLPDEDDEDDEEDEKIKEAMNLIKDVLDTFERTVGLTHPKALRCQQIFGGFHWGNEDYKTAESIFLEALERSMNSLGSDVETTIHLKKDLAILYSEGELDKEFEEIETLFNDVIKGYRYLYGSTHDYVLDTLECYGEACINFEEYKKALPLLTECYNEKKKKYSDLNKKTLSIVRKLAKCWWELEEMEEASKYYELLIDNAKIVYKKRGQKVLKKIIKEYKKFKESPKKKKKGKKGKKC